MGSVAYVEDHLPLIIGLSEAATGNGVLLILSQIFEEGKHFQKLPVLLVMVLIDIVHDLLEDLATDEDQFAFSQSEN